mgnify:CR=1 FL=1
MRFFRNWYIILKITNIYRLEVASQVKTADIMGVRFHAVTLNEAVDYAMNRIHTKKKGYIVTPNPEIVYLTLDDPAFRSLVNGAALVLPDGIGIIYAAKILGQALFGRVTGIDFADLLMHRMAQEQMRLFLLGAKPGVAEMAAEQLQKKHPGLIIAGCRDGYFKDAQEAADAVNAAGGAEAVFVCLGAPKQEYFMAEWMDKLDATLLCGLGGSLDVFAGTVKRAPAIFSKLGLEWLYRLCKEPWRFRRMLKLPLFLLLAIKTRLLPSEKEETP